MDHLPCDMNIGSFGWSWCHLLDGAWSLHQAHAAARQELEGTLISLSLISVVDSGLSVRVSSKISITRTPKGTESPLLCGVVL